MPRYEVEINGSRYEVEAPDEKALSLAIRQMQTESAPAAPSSASGDMDNYYSSGIYSGQYNPLGPIARSVDAFASNAQKAPLFGWGDEIASTLLPGDSAENRQRMNDRFASMQENNPVASVAGEIAGSAMGAGALSRLGVLPSAKLPATAPLLGRMAVGAGEGFGLGALTGAGNGEGTEGRLQDALWTGGTGAALGGAIPLAVQGLSSGYRNVADYFSRSQAAKNAGVSPGVADHLARTMDADGTLGSAGAANMARAGNEAMLADAGRNAQDVLDTAIQRGGPGASLARSRIDERLARDSSALNDALDSSLGTPQGVTASRTAVREGSAAARSAAYDGPNGAYAQAIDYASPQGQQLEQLVRSRVPGDIISKANRLMQLEGKQSQQILARIADDGSVVFEQLPDVRQLDYITRALNQAAESGEGAGALGGQTTLGRAYQGLARDVRGTLRNAVPEYGAALDTAADSISRSKAIDLGARLLSPSMRRDQIAEAISGYSAAERNALAQGVRSHIDDTVANVTRTMQDGNTEAREAYKAIRDLSSRASREKLSIALGDKRVKPLFDELDRIAQSFNLKASIADNSRTFARQATNRMVEDMTSPGVFGKAAQGEPLNATKRIAQLLTGQTPERVAARQDKIYSEIADFLTRPSQQALPAFRAMQNYQGQTAVNQARSAAIARLLMSGGRNTTNPIASLLVRGQ